MKFTCLQRPGEVFAEESDSDSDEAPSDEAPETCHGSRQPRLESDVLKIGVPTMLCAQLCPVSVHVGLTDTSLVVMVGLSPRPEHRAGLIFRLFTGLSLQHLQGQQTQKRIGQSREKEK